MKKYFFAIVGLIASYSSTVNAQDIFSIAPIESVAENVKSDSAEAGIMDFVLAGEDHDYFAMQFDLYVPEALDFDHTYFEKGAGIQYTEKRGQRTYMQNIDAVQKTSDMPGFNHFLIVVSPNGTNKVKMLPEVIFTAYFGTTTAGVYPVYIKNMNLAYGGGATESTKYPVITNYVHVGDASTKGKLDVIGVVAPNVISGVSSSSVITGLNFAQATTVYGGLNLSNVGITALPEAGLAVEGTTSYTRNLSTQYGTVCVPFALTSTEETQYYALSEKTGNKLTFQPVETVPAGTPALVKGNISASVNNATLVAPVSGEMVGTYSNVVPGAVGYFIGQDKFWALEPTTKVGSYKAYIPGALGAKSLKIFIEDETGIHEVSSEISSDDIYNLQGMKLNKTQKGINIVGGKKVILK